MPTLSEKIGKVIDRALAEPATPPKTGNKFPVPGVNLSKLVLVTVSSGIKVELASGSDLKQIRALTDRWIRAFEIENSHHPQHADIAWQRQGEKLSADIAGGKDISDLADIASREDFRSDYETIRTACKSARREITASAVPTITAIFKRYATAIGEKLAVMERVENGQCSAVGMSWQPSPDYIIHHAVHGYAERMADPLSYQHTDANPLSLIEGLNIKL